MEKMIWRLRNRLANFLLLLAYKTRPEILRSAVGSGVTSLNGKSENFGQAKIRPTSPASGGSGAVKAITPQEIRDERKQDVIKRFRTLLK